MGEVRLALEQLKTLLPQHRILHVATHGLPPGAQRLGAQLGGARGLSAFELSELAFPTGSLAVLGACESALDAQTGTDNSSLVSAARTAGADQVVGSLWPIDDQVTSELFATFYQGLAQGHTPARALREAQRAVAKSHPHPYYWAALQVVSGPRR